MALRKTKIVATTGPACGAPATLQAVLAAGMDVARLDLLHGTLDEQRARVERVRAVAAKAGANLAVLVDTRGFEIRTGAVDGGAAVLVPAARAPKLISREMLRKMRPGSVLVDIAIDQGGCAETSRPTTHDHPVYVEDGVTHYCVANMPGAWGHRIPGLRLLMPGKDNFRENHKHRRLSRCPKRAGAKTGPPDSILLSSGTFSQKLYTSHHISASHKASKAGIETSSKKLGTLYVSQSFHSASKSFSARIVSRILPSSVSFSCL